MPRLNAFRIVWTKSSFRFSLRLQNSGEYLVPEDGGSTMRGKIPRGSESPQGQEGESIFLAEELAANGSRFRELRGRISL